MAAVNWLATHDGDRDLTVVDLFQKDGSGFGVLAGCRDRKPRQRVVILTNYATPAVRQECLALGADLFDKSTELEDLFAFCADLGASGQTPRSRPAK